MTESKRKIIKPEPRVSQAAYTLALPAHIAALNMDNLYLLDADVRNTVSAALGCLFTLTNGKVACADGRHFDMRLVGKTLELVP